MTKLVKLKTSLQTMSDLEVLTDMLEQSAARTIARMRTTILDSRPYFQEIWRIHSILKQLAPPAPDIVHKHLVVMIGIDWGMPGNLLNLVVSQAQRVQQEHGADMLIAGKMAHSYFRKDEGHTIHYFDVPKDSILADIQPIYKVVAKYARVTIVYPGFESLSKQPILSASFSIGDNQGKELDGGSGDASLESEIAAKRFIIEPNVKEIVNYLNEAVVGLTVHHYFAEAMLAYSAAQMVAMRNGHDNAHEEVGKLRSLYYRARRELIDSKLRELYGSRTVQGKGASNG